MIKELFRPFQTAILGLSVTQLQFVPGDIDRLRIVPGSKIEPRKGDRLRVPDGGQAAFLTPNNTWVGISDEVEHHLPDGKILHPVAKVIIKEPGNEDDPQRIRVTSGESMAMPLGGLPVVVSHFRRKHKKPR